MFSLIYWLKIHRIQGVVDVRTGCFMPSGREQRMPCETLLQIHGRPDFISRPARNIELANSAALSPLFATTEERIRQRNVTLFQPVQLYPLD